MVSRAQDPQFSQFYSNPLYLNPGFAGTSTYPRLVSNYRNQWPSSGNTFVTYNLSYDQYLLGLNGAIGFQALYDREVNGSINTIQSSFVYCYHLKLNDEFFFTMAIQAVEASGSITMISGLANLTINWRRPLIKIKDLDNTAPKIMYNRSQGEIRLQGFAATAAISNVAATSNQVFQGVLDTAYTSIVQLNVVTRSTKSGTTYTSTYSAYKTGQGFTFRNLAPRTWALDGIQTFQIID